MIFSLTEENKDPRKSSALCEDIVNKVTPILNRDKRIIAAYLLGSVLSGRMHPQSDIDIGILTDPPKSFSTMDRLTLAALLQDESPYEFDIGIIGTHDLIYSTQAIMNGRCIYFRDKFKKDLFVATCLSLYFELKQERVKVEHAYQIR